MGPSAAITKIRKYTLDLYKELEKKVDHSAGLRLNGALSIAQNKERWQELQRQATTAQLYNVDVQILDKIQIKKATFNLDKKVDINDNELDSLKILSQNKNEIIFSYVFNIYFFFKISFLIFRVPRAKLVIMIEANLN